MIFYHLIGVLRKHQVFSILCLSISFSLFLEKPQASPSLFKKKILLTVGEPYELTKKIQTKKIYVGEKSLLSITKRGSHLILLGKKEGQTSLRIPDFYSVFICKKEFKEKVLKVNHLLKQFLGLEWDLEGKTLQVKGQLHRLYDWWKLAQLSKKHNVSYEFKALLDEDIKPLALSFFHQLFKNETVPQFHWHQLPVVWLPKDTPLSLYKEKLKPFGLLPQNKASWLKASPFIKVEVALIETSKTLSFAGGGGLYSFKDFLNLLLSRGKGKLLHHSSLMVQSGKETSLHSGGQIPFAEQNLETGQQNFKWKSHGLTLKVKVQLYEKNNLQLHITGEISEPATQLSFQSLPPLKTRTFDGAFDIKLEQILKVFELKTKSTGSSFQSHLLSSLKGGKNHQRSFQTILLRTSLVKSQKKQTIQEHLNREIRSE